MPSRRTSMIAAMSVAAATSAIGLMGGAPAANAATAAPSQADGIYLWTQFHAMTGCINAGKDACFREQNGTVEGVTDVTLLLDEIGHGLGLHYSDNSTVPGVTKSNEVVQVYDGTPLPLFIGPGTDLTADARNGTARVVASGTSPSGPPLDVSYGYDYYRGSDKAGGTDDYEDEYPARYY